MVKLIFSLSLVVFGLLIGYVFQVLMRKKIIKLKTDINKLRINLQKIALLFFNPIALIGAIWLVRFDIKLIALPFIGITALVFGGILAYMKVLHN